jgi:hypothetical protein
MGDLTVPQPPATGMTLAQLAECWPFIRAIDYYADGTIKRVEFADALLVEEQPRVRPYPQWPRMIRRPVPVLRRIAFDPRQYGQLKKPAVPQRS